MDIHVDFSKPYTERLTAAFSGSELVSKREVRLMYQSLKTSGMPGYVVEFLLASARKAGKSALADILSHIKKYSVDADSSPIFLNKVQHDLSGKIIGVLSAIPNMEKGTSDARIDQLSKAVLDIPKHILQDYPEILTGGLWGTIHVGYDTSGKKAKMVVEKFDPYQLSKPDVKRFRTARNYFRTNEWLDLLVNTLGFDPKLLSYRQKLLLLVRLVALVQANYNCIELGPKGTGKTYALRNLTSKAHLVAGSKISLPSLVYDLRRHQPGVLMQKAVVILDEIASTTVQDTSLVATLQDYMESGKITRVPGKTLSSNCGIMALGNVDLNETGEVPHRRYNRGNVQYLFSVLPPEFQQTAFFDRLHALIPGWEMPKISDSMFSNDLGLVSDYFGAVLADTGEHSLRRDEHYLLWLQSHIKLHADKGRITLREQNAIFQTLSGLLKLLYPNRKIPTDKEELEPLASLAIELRQRIQDQMHALDPGEFPRKNVSWELVKEQK